MIIRRLNELFDREDKDRGEVGYPTFPETIKFKDNKEFEVLVVKDVIHDGPYWSVHIYIDSEQFVYKYFNLKDKKSAARLAINMITDMKKYTSQEIEDMTPSYFYKNKFVEL